MTADRNEIVGHAQLVPTESPDTIELKSIAGIPVRDSITRTLALDLSGDAEGD